MKLKEFKDDEILKPMEKATPEDVRGFLIHHAIPIANYMGDREAHPGVIPFLHARQLGLDYNIVVSIENMAKPKIIINPTFVVLDKKDVKKGVQLSESFKSSEHIKRMFLAERSEKILLKYDEYTDVDTAMTPGSDEYEGEYAILLQEMCDFSEGKLITRFTEIIEKEEDMKKDI